MKSEIGAVSVHHTRTVGVGFGRQRIMCGERLSGRRLSIGQTGLCLDRRGLFVLAIRPLEFGRHGTERTSCWAFEN